MTNLRMIAKKAVPAPILRLIRRTLSLRLRKDVLDIVILKRPAPTKEEEARIAELRSEIKALPPLPDSSKIASAERNWIERQRKIRQSILERDPRDFLAWEEIRYSMICEFSPLELKRLMRSKDWPAMREALTEPEFCEENFFSWTAPLVNRRTAIGNAYKLLQLTSTYGVDVSKMDTIVEFGGGYGSMARLCYKLGFKGTYVIFDLPEFSALQKYFLKSSGLGIETLSTPAKSAGPAAVLLSKISDLKEQVRLARPDIFIATWSLSESPVPLRDSIVDLVKDAPYYLLAYQAQFPMHAKGTNNIEYFKKLRESMGDRHWKNTRIMHLPRDYYLVSKK